MKHLIIVLCIVAVLIAAGTACASRTTDNTVAPSAQDTTPGLNTESNTVIEPMEPADLQSGTVINVDDLMTNPDSHTGQIRVEGVVSSASQEQQNIGIIDSREFAACGVTTCPSFILPVQWSGLMPYVGDSIQVVGEIQKSDGKFIFVATALENLNRQTESTR